MNATKRPGWRLFYFDFVQHPVFLELLAARPEVQVRKLAFAGDVAANFAEVARGQVYQATSVRDDLPPHYAVDAAFLARAPELLVVSTHGAGYDTVDVAACTVAGVLLVNQAGGNAEGVAEHAVAMMLAVLKRIPDGDARTRRGTVRKRAELMGRDILGRTVGVIGLGNIGRRVAEILRLAFGCRILAYDPHLDAAECARRGAEKTELDALLAASDVVSVHCPHSAETAGMLGAREFALMRPRAVLVNTARFGIHDEAALHAAIVSGHLAGAGLDVWEREPPPTDHPLLQLETVIATPHTAGITEDSRARVARFAADQLFDIFDGRDPPRPINPEVLPRFRARLAAWRARASAE
jgi:D-3-phosphoglycerate dehydrogenase / 2-oxoglutarate reductase